MEKPEDLVDLEPDTRRKVYVVPDVTDVLVSLLLWSLSFVMFFRVALIGNLCNRSPFLSSKGVHIVVQPRSKR